jgi:hypothetical protein
MAKLLVVLENGCSIGVRELDQRIPSEGGRLSTVDLLIKLACFVKR